MFISFNEISTNNKSFTQNDIDENNHAIYPGGLIDIFLVLDKLKEKGLLINLNDYSSILIHPGENRCIVIRSNENFKKIKTINIQGSGKRVQIIRIDGFSGVVNITHCKPLDLLDLQNNFGKIILENDMQIHRVRVSGNGDGFECRNLQILNEFLINGANIENDFIIENIEFFTDGISSVRFDIYGSRIGKLSIIESNFPINGLTISNSSFSEVYFYRTNLENLKLIGVTGGGFGNLIKDKNEFSEMKEFYRQLKHSHDEIGNKTEANKFFAKEMEYYEKSLTKKEWDKKLISFIQRISNNYGNSWLRPMLLIIFTSFGYTLFFSCWNFHCTCGGAQNWECFGDYWLKNISQFPTELKNINSLSFFIYVIIMGSLIYQLLVALRRISQR